MPILDFPSNYVLPGETKEFRPVSIAMHAGASDEFLSEVAEQYLVSRDFIYTFCIMCSPESKIETYRVMKAVSLDQIYQCIRLSCDLCIDESVDGAVALDIANRENVDSLIDKLFESNSVGPIASGYILRWIVSRWQTHETRADATLTKAASVIEEWGKRHSVVGAGRQNIMRNVWRKYSTVSHLWAAFHLMQEAEISASTPSGFVIFCSTAQWLLEQGAAIVPRGRQQGVTVLSLDSAWSIPDWIVQRTQRGSIEILWSDELGAHDIRETRAGFTL